MAIGKEVKQISPQDAEAVIFGHAVGIDFTRRDLQAEAKQKLRPWDAAKSFDHSAPMSEIVPVDLSGHLRQGKISLSINGDITQQGDIGDLIWTVPEIIAELSTYFTLEPGDLVFTGTPGGVGAVLPGDVLHGSVEG